MSLVLIVHESRGSNTDPTLNGHLHYPNDLDKPLNESVSDKIRKYHTDYNNNPPNTPSFIPDITNTSGRLHSEFVRILFLQPHRETNHFFATSGVQLARHDRGDFHYLRSVFSRQLTAKTGSILAKSSSLRFILNMEGINMD